MKQGEEGDGGAHGITEQTDEKVKTRPCPRERRWIERLVEYAVEVGERICAVWWRR